MLAAWCEDLLALPREAWAAYAHSREPLRGKVPMADYMEFYNKAEQCGVQQAQQLRAQMGGISCLDMAKQLGVQVVERDCMENHGVMMFACFYEPDCIELYTDNAQATQSMLNTAGLDERLGYVDVCEMLLAHELFHVIQLRTPQLYINQKHIRLWSLGRWHNDSKLVSLEEVAAMAFAQELMGMQVTPYIYDVWMLLPSAPAQAQALYSRLMQWNEEGKANANNFAE
jgi:hypothetical protein